MSLGDLSRRAVATSYGELVFWSRPEIYERDRPVVLVIGGMFSPVEDLANLPDVLGLLADGCIMRFPGGGSALLSKADAATVMAAISEAIESAFKARPVVLMGISIGAVAALGVRAANLARIIAIEPTLVPTKLWPIVAPLREMLAKRSSPVTDQTLHALFGLTQTAQEDRDYLGVLQDLPCPVDVVLGDAPLLPQRPLERFPSLVGEDERRVLARTPKVRLHLGAGAGHNIIGQSPRIVQNVLLEACRRASAQESLDIRRLDEPLLDATPLTARRLLYWGPEGDLFRRAFLRADPKAELTAWPADHPEDDRSLADFDAIIAAGPPSPGRLAQLAAVLNEGGHLIARWGEPADGLVPALAPHSLFLRDAIDEAGTGVLRAQKCAPGRRPGEPLHVQTIAFASLMMDIRTRLPVRAMASDPELKISYDSPPTPMAKLPFETPKFVILQRSADPDISRWRRFLAAAIRDGRIVILEFDDHPLLIAEVLDQAPPENAMGRFAYGHAVQTSTPPLVDVFRAYNPEVVAFPNSAFDLAPFPEGPRRRRVIYGGVLRGEYAVTVARSLAPTIAQFPDTEFVVIGDRQVFDALPTQAKEFHEYMSFEAYLRLMAGCSISLSPIAPLPLRETKSDAKFVDASRSGALTIASPTVYDRVIEPGVNGLIAREVADWAPLLSQALGDGDLRRNLARRAWEYVRDERMFADQIALRRTWYWDLWSRREALNEALMDRVPGLRELVSG